MIRTTTTWLLPLIATVACAQSSVVDIERDLKCKPFDYSAGVDNAAKINAALAQVGVTIFDPIYVNGKWYAIADTLRFPTRIGGKIATGGGRDYEQPEDCQGKQVGSAARFIWTGKPGGTFLDFADFGWIIEDLTLYGGPRNDGKDTRTHCACGLFIHDYLNWVPSAKSTFSITFVGFDCAVDCSKIATLDHTDNTEWPWFGVQDCAVGFRAEHCNSCCHHFTHVWNGGCNVLFDAIEGGGIITETIAQDMPGTILRIGAISPNAGAIDLRGIRVDNHARGVCLLECTAQPYVEISESGNLNNQSVDPAKPLVKENGFKPRLHLDFDNMLPADLGTRYPR